MSPRPKRPFVVEGLPADDPLRALIEGRMEAIRGRRGARPTAVRVGFTDENGPKGGVDIRCAITVELPRRPPVHADALAENHRLAFDGAFEALEREVARDRERARDVQRRPKKYFVARQALLPDGDIDRPLPIERREPA
ncbi:MAG TPA: HPF/RaiA family ribosome-associated protein [Candidatus Tectomicrobia bacterium]|nr:HPF/RaiA family ribosome-associated protein [Candidatus Tectomicrobia bacterium]